MIIVTGAAGFIGRFVCLRLLDRGEQVVGVDDFNSYYDPALKEGEPPRVGVLFNIIDRKTNQQVYSSNTMLINDLVQPGNPLVPVGFKIPMDQIQAGDYRVEIKGRDSMGNVSSVRAAEFTIE